MLSWDAGEANQAVSHYVEDETTKSDYDGEHEAPRGEPNSSTHFPIALDADETPSILTSDTPVHDGLLAMRLLRHFKEGPGQW